LVNIYIYVIINYIGTIIVINTDDYVKVHHFDSLIFMLGGIIIASKLFYVIKRFKKWNVHIFNLSDMFTIFFYDFKVIIVICR